jgi:hypothetical protein
MALGEVRRLPNAERALVEERRVREYLLNREHESGGQPASRRASTPQLCYYQ